VEKRKVQRTGGSTYIVSLPKSWAKKRMEFGETVCIEEREGYLKLYPDNSVEEQEFDSFDEISSILEDLSSSVERCRNEVDANNMEMEEDLEKLESLHREFSETAERMSKRK
jgi:phosphate uptake regulator